MNLYSQSDTINQKDAAGLKQGYWIFYGKDLPERGYCDSCKVEEGKFIDGKKNGQWILYHRNGVPRTLGHFVNARPVGYYEKYDTLSRKIENGNYYKGKQVGLFERYYDSGCLAFQKLFDSTGREVYVYLYKDDCKIDSSNMGSRNYESVKINPEQYRLVYISHGGTYPNDFKALNYRTDSIAHGKISYFNVCDSLIELTDSLKMNLKGTDGSAGFTKYNTEFNPNGYNKVYTKEDELWLDGYFVDSKLYKGKVYKYDSDGILLKIEIWCNGSYCCDGQL